MSLKEAKDGSGRRIMPLKAAPADLYNRCGMCPPKPAGCHTVSTKALANGQPRRGPFFTNCIWYGTRERSCFGQCG
jgi:hypothetical protein